MPKRIPPLTDTQVRAAKGGEKCITIFDGGGLYLLVSPSGGKLWRLKYRYLGKQKLLSLGSYPEISLQDAREKRESARKLLANGINPSAAKKAQKNAAIEAQTHTFEAIAREWHKKKEGEWDKKHAVNALKRLERHVFPKIGKHQIDVITASDLYKILITVEDHSREVAHRVKSYLYNIFHHAQMLGKLNYNPASDLRNVLKANKHKHMAAPINPKEAIPLLVAIDGYHGNFEVECALKLAPLLFVRPGELRHMEWQEIDFDAATWTIPKHKMKMEEDHIVPLSRQALDILKKLHNFNGHKKYAFPCRRSDERCMSNNTLNAALRRMGFTKTEITIHGVRAMARTMIAEQLSVLPDIIEAQLAHKVADRHGKAYNRAIYLAERKTMMQRWANYLDDLKKSYEI